MIIEKEIISQIYRPYFFITSIFDVDTKYFKKRIDEGVQVSNLNYTTNVHGQHTDWKFFNEDKKFGSVVAQTLDYLEQANLELEPCYLGEAWGLIEQFGEFTKKHHHGDAYFSGVLYLHDHPQKLYFPEINQEVTPKKGRAVIFTSFLKHYTKRNLGDIGKYALSFNFYNTPIVSRAAQ
tara:strand:+ start:295 stop:831 length:537 start_codon:yes stop_codon:yes gene_type:complete